MIKQNNEKKKKIGTAQRRIVFKTLSNIYDEAFLQKKLTTKSC